MVTMIVLCLVFFGLGILVGARGYYTYANHLYRKYPEFFRSSLALKIGNLHTCSYVLDREKDIFCRTPAANQCMDCHERHCDEHMFLHRCGPYSEVEAAKQ